MEKTLYVEDGLIDSLECTLETNG